MYSSVFSYHFDSFQNVFLSVANPCLGTSLCPGAGKYCVADIYNSAGYECVCNALDGYLAQAGGTCERLASRIFRLRVVGVNGNPVAFTPEFSNHISTASKQFLSLSARVVLYVLQQNGLTSAVRDVIGIRVVSGGSLIVEYAAFYSDENSAPTISTIQYALQSGSRLSDSADYLDVDTGYVTSTSSVSSCPPNYCANGGSCSVDFVLYPIFSFTCSCQTSFTGERCETVIPLEPGVTITTTVSMTTQSPGLSTLSIILIAAGILLVLLLTLLLIMCITCMVMRPRHKLVRYGRPGWGDGMVPIRYGHHNYGLDHDGDRESESRSDEIRMHQLQQALGHSMYPQPDSAGRLDSFSRPYVASGNEELYRVLDGRPRDSRPAPAGAVFNPTYRY
ncbi:uncharacterized protein LOC119720527 [Patiria miniata]|uniref:EGF-like domain-containing protein n=1 Tax=Patiria miniata TaxID=46514 RepID=A0A913Z5T3_PATMI|nr:uncharacterized protein LOC119720527 [Patiria miniata]